MPYRPGERAGRYEVLRLLGRGACGEVFQVRGARGVTYALKVVPCDPTAGTESAAARVREAAIAEARLLQGLRHPHIVACQEVFFDADQHVVRLVLEYMNGGDLQRLVAKRREQGGQAFSTHFARRVLAAIGSALDYVHCKGVLHRDVKPANVLLSQEFDEIETLKLGDFGIAKLVEAATLKAHSLVGTPYYFAPELVAGQAYGAAVDCWALGACLYEVMTLRRAFEASNHLALMRLICDASPPELPAGAAEDLRAAVFGLLEKRPEQRMAIREALAVSPAVAALAAGCGRGAPVAEVEPEDTVASPGRAERAEEPRDDGWAARRAASPTGTLDTLGVLLAAGAAAREDEAAATLHPADELRPAPLRRPLQGTMQPVVQYKPLAPVACYLDKANLLVGMDDEPVDKHIISSCRTLGGTPLGEIRRRLGLRPALGAFEEDGPAAGGSRV